MRRPPALTEAVLVGILAATALAGPAAAQAPAPSSGELEHLVILLRPTEIDELTREALARITGELAAARFRVVIFPLDPSVDPIEQVDSVGGDLQPVAAFALVRAPGGYGGSVELWISDRLAHRTTIQRMRIQGGDVSRAAEVLAVESVELIRISLASLWPRPAELVPPPPPPEPAPPPEPPPQAELSVAVGMGLMRQLGDQPATWAPVARVGYRWAGGFGLFVAARGLGPDVELTQSEGSASVRREAGWLGLSETFRVQRRLRPSIFVGAGAERIRAVGSAPAAQNPRSATAWSAVLTGGLGVAATVVPHVALVLDVQGMVFVPEAKVLVGAAETRLDRPSVLVDGGICASF